MGGAHGDGRFHLAGVVVSFFLEHRLLLGADPLIHPGGVYPHGLSAGSAAWLARLRLAAWAGEPQSDGGLLDPDLRAQEPLDAKGVGVEDIGHGGSVTPPRPVIRRRSAPSGTLSELPTRLQKNGGRNGNPSPPTLGAGFVLFEVGLEFGVFAR